ADPRGDCRRTARRPVPRRHQADRCGQDAVRCARRDGHQLDPQPAPLLARERGRSGRRPLHQRSARAMTVRSVAVLGAGTMGAQIAAHFANAGVPVLLLDLTAEIAHDGLKRARSLKPDPFFTPETAALIATGGFDADFHTIATADWIMEAVVERIDVKRPLLERVDASRRPGSIVSTNTSGISVTALAEGRSDDFRRHWLGTHFF